MQRNLGLILIVVGILLSGFGLVGTIYVLVAPNGPLGALTIFLLLDVVGGVLIFAGVRKMQGAKSIFVKQVPKDRVGPYLADKAEMRQHNGRTYEVFYRTPVTGKYSRPSQLTIKLPAETPTVLAFTAENWFDRLCKRIGIAREHQTGDTDFDEAIYIRGPSFAYADRFLEDQSKRSALLALKDLGFREIKLTLTHAEVSWTGFNPASNDQPELTALTVENLSVLASKLPPNDSDYAALPTDMHKTWLALLWIGVILFGAMLGFAFYYPPIRTWELIKIAFLLFILALPVFGWMSAYLLSGRANSHDQWGLLMGFGVFLIAVGSVGFVAAVNAAADTAPLTDRTATIMNTRVSKGRRGSRNYYASVQAWDRPGELLDFGISANEFGLIAPGQSKLELTTGPGFLGIEWIKAKRVRP